MDRNKVRTIHQQILDALKPIMAQHKLTLAKESCRFDSTSVRLTLELGETAVVEAQKAAVLADAGVTDKQVFQYGGKSYRVVGTKPGRGANWVIAERLPDGKRFRFHDYDIPTNANNKKRTEAEIIADLQGVENGLSPENLSMDGEASRSQVAKRYRELTARRAKLVSELGRKPTDAELYGR